MMTREERLEFCLICFKSQRTMKKGLVCSITQEQADFEGDCINFELDPTAEKMEMERKLRATGDHESGDPINFQKNKDQGVLFVFLSFILSIIFWVMLSGYVVIVLFPGLLFTGIAMYRRGVEQEKVFHKMMAEKESKK